MDSAANRPGTASPDRDDDLLLLADLAFRGYVLQRDRLEGDDRPPELVDVVFLITAAQMLRSVGVKAAERHAAASVALARYDQDIAKLFAADRLGDDRVTATMRNALLHGDPGWFRERGLMLTTTQLLSVGLVRPGEPAPTLAGTPDPWGLAVLDFNELYGPVGRLHMGLAAALRHALEASAGPNAQAP